MDVKNFFSSCSFSQRVGLISLSIINGNNSMFNRTLTMRKVHGLNMAWRESSLTVSAEFG